MHGRLLVATLVAASSLAVAAAPQDFNCTDANICTEALKMGVPGSLERLTALAESGDADAQLYLGAYYYGKLKTPSQPSGDSWLQGTKWLRMAAAQGNPETLFQGNYILAVPKCIMAGTRPGGEVRHARDH